MAKRDWEEIEKDADPQVNIRVPETLLQEVDEVLEERGFTNRSEFIRTAIRDALSPQPELSDEALEQIEESKKELEEGEYVGVDDL
jgi:metal-responsive CopG/Arc/MetJ family transcriptional regulator